MAIGTKSSAAPAQRGNSLGRVVEWRWALLSLWLAGTVLFLVRAIAGYFLRPLSSLGLIAVAVVAVIIAIELRIALRGGWQAMNTPPDSTATWLAQLLPSLGLIFLATGFTVAGAHPTGLTIMWVLVAAELAFGAAGPWTMPMIQRWLTRSKVDRANRRLTSFVPGRWKRCGRCRATAKNDEARSTGRASGAGDSLRR